MAEVEQSACTACLSWRFPHTTLSVRDTLKMIAPFSWAVIGVMAAFVYILVPVMDTPARDPRWVPAGLALLSSVVSWCLVYDIWSFQRDVVYQAHGGADKDRQRKVWRKLYLSSFLTFVAVALLAFFLGVGQELDACGHDSCGSDASWCAVSLVFGLIWLYVLHRTIRSWKREVHGHEMTNVGGRPPASSDDSEFP